MLSLFLGEHFHFRTTLSEDECKRRIEQFKPPSLLSDGFSDAPVGVWKWHTIYLWHANKPRGPRLVGRMRPSGMGTEIKGRAGMDHIMFFGAVGVTIFFLATLLTLPEIGSVEKLAVLPVLLIPWAVYFLKRSSPHGGGLIDFLQDLLEAQSLKHRSGDPIERT